MMRICSYLGQGARYWNQWWQDWYSGAAGQVAGTWPKMRLV